MKAAMITEEQITAIKEVLVFYCIPLNEEKFRAAFEAVESLEVQEPVARFNWNEAKFEWLTKYDYHKHHMTELFALEDEK